MLITKFGTCCSNITPCERECDYIDTESTVRNPEIQYGNQIGRINMECSELKLEEERERGERKGRSERGDGVSGSVGLLPKVIGRFKGNLVLT